jgi:ketosteroid isomerase-like protein
MSIDPVALVKRYHAALDAYDEAVVGPMFADDAIYSSPGLNGRIEGRDAIIAAFSTYFAEHPDQRAEDDSIEQTGPREARASWRLRATSASTGAPVLRRGIETLHFDAGGLIVRVEVEDR